MDSLKGREKENNGKKKGPQNVTAPEALFNVAILENHFHPDLSRVGRVSACLFIAST
ncbi:hypothetical protein FHS21_003468 [Phyllobacterium trifolii]|jgi:hypothetical protein|uniref:Uncharacterized protein n=1 Tax=Phyllobacterium trifolii TaxID=300193 RepID=A0A839UDW0_9HYPH|nr:hypothetical protein [Phyllobacterium trifolii]